jgi:hypothetical protein
MFVRDENFSREAGQMAKIAHNRRQGDFCDVCKFFDGHRRLLFSSQTIIMDYINDPKQERLCFSISPSGAIMVFSNFPPTTKSKVCYCIKESPVALTAENIKNVGEFQFS